MASRCVTIYRILIRRQAEQTKDADYEYISYHYFPPVGYQRNMYWRAGNGRIGVGPPGQVTLKMTNTENGTGEELHSGLGVLVMETTFKLLSGV